MAKSGGIFDFHCLKLHAKLMCHHILASFSLSFCNWSVVKVLNTWDPYWWGSHYQRNYFPWDDFGLVVLDPILGYRAYEVRRGENLGRKKGSERTPFPTLFIPVSSLLTLVFIENSLGHWLHLSFGLFSQLVTSKNF